MARKRIRYRLSDKTKDVDLSQYEDEIVNTINEVVPGKNPEVDSDGFVIDLLEHSERVKMGKALARIKELQQYGMVIETFRLFTGRIIEVDDKEEKKEER